MPDEEFIAVVGRDRLERIGGVFDGSVFGADLAASILEYFGALFDAMASVVPV